MVSQSLISLTKNQSLMRLSNTRSFWTSRTLLATQARILMLSLPLSLLPKELFAQIVQCVADLPSETKSLRSLSLADWAFTELCQAHFFKYLVLADTSAKCIPKTLAKIANILNDKPSAAYRVRKIKIFITRKNNARLFSDPTFINIFQALAKSPIPPRKFFLSGSFVFEDPILIVGQLTKTFLSQTLTVLRLVQCRNVPVTLFLICPLLRDVILENVEATKYSYDEFPGEQCSGRELPALECLQYCNSQSLIEQIITPPPRFHAGVVIWSKLRVLKLYPLKKKEMTGLQPILDSVCNTLEELHLESYIKDNEQLFLNGRVNLKDLSCLRVFAVYAILESGVLESTVPHDINIVLRTIPMSNRVTTLSMGFSVSGKPPFRACSEDGWAGLCNEIIRISAGKTLKLNLDVCVYSEFTGQRQLHERVLTNIASLSDYPNISTNFRCDPVNTCSCDLTFEWCEPCEDSEELAI